MKKILCFGDSWAEGAELKPNEKPFVHWVAQNLNMSYSNFAKSGDSFGIILHTVVANLKKIDADTLVIIVIPPDTRWYDENQVEGFYTIMNCDDRRKNDHAKFLNKKTLEWFKYHHALFVFSMQRMLEDTGCRYIMTHNYGQLVDVTKYNLQINYNNFLSMNSLTEILSNRSSWKSYPEHLEKSKHFVQDGPAEKEFTGIYFEGCMQHPNELGHKQIAELILEKYRNDKK
jgi:hypothetical protein